jgi:hypothetical protein
MPSDHRCAECGLLTIQSFATRELEEVDEAIRKGGHLPSKPLDASGAIKIRLPAYDSPKCSVSAHDLSAEYGAAGFVETFNKLRPCDQFIEWHPGFSPKEHREMQLLREVETRNLTWQRQQEALAETRHQETRRDVSQSNQRSLRIAILSVAAAIVSAGAAVGAVLNR